MTKLVSVADGGSVLRFARLCAALVLMSTLEMQLAYAQAPTPAVGVQGTTLARGPFVATERIHLMMQAHVAGKVDTVQVRDAAEMVVQQISIAPGGHTPWHTHFGPAVVVVKEGTLTIYDGDDDTCAGRDYGPNESFVDLGQGHMHIAVNESESVAVSVYVTYFDVPATAPSPLVPVLTDPVLPCAVLP